MEFDKKINVDEKDLTNSTENNDQQESENLESENENDSKVIEMPAFALSGRIIFPNISTTFYSTKQRPLNAISQAINYSNLIFVSLPTKPADASGKEEFFNTGVVCRVRKVMQMGGPNVRIFVDSLYRAVLQEIVSNDEFCLVKVIEQPDVHIDGFDENLSLDVAKSKLKELSEKSNKVTKDQLEELLKIGNLCDFMNAVAYELQPNSESFKQEFLEEYVVPERFKLFCSALWKIIEFVELDARIAESVKQSVDKGQKEYYLREQLKAVHKELGDDENEVEQLREQLLSKKMPLEIEQKSIKELDRMRRMSSSSPDYSVLRTYIDYMIELPFNEQTEDTKDLKSAIAVLDSDHFGLEKVKQRIIEYIAVMKITGKISGSILCLVGPPGVGKTSVASSIAHALNRKFVRMSLGGVKDEAEIRGHRKTYIGAMPGRIINGLKIAGVNNPVFLLDEIDKLSSDLRGDPASALLEVLDPEQNKTFRDRYMEIPYDLSNVLFITTANSLEPIPAPLLDRMEVIELSGYTEEEKIQIAKRYLVPKRAELNGLKDKNVVMTDNALRKLVKGYTMEAGVRNLERQVDAVCRKLAIKIAENAKFNKCKITEQAIEKYLGAPKYVDDDVKKESLVGVARGLAWTAFGGTTLEIETCLIKGKGEIVLTGKLGDVMKESARTALSYIKANAESFEIDLEKFENFDIHIHVPEGATPKDGPSAGITLATSILSAYTQKPVRGDVAMTGEITLLGSVLPIGGLKEKSLAAYRIGIRDIIIPFDNKKDVEDVPENIRKELHYIPVKNASEVFQVVFSERVGG